MTRWGFHPDFVFFLLVRVLEAKLFNESKVFADLLHLHQNKQTKKDRDSNLYLSF